MNLERVYFSYDKWEEWHFGMWRTVSGVERQRFVQQAIEFTGDHKLYGKWMMKVIKAWPYSCLHNLSNVTMNRQAWVGHAACCLAIGCPEDITRVAWHELTTKQQDKANHQADMAIAKFERMMKRGIQLCLRLD